VSDIKNKIYDPKEINRFLKKVPGKNRPGLAPVSPI
jgi:hypothetical protein